METTLCGETGALPPRGRDLATLPLLRGRVMRTETWALGKQA